MKKYDHHSISNKDMHAIKYPDIVKKQEKIYRC